MRWLIAQVVPEPVKIIFFVELNITKTNVKINFERDRKLGRKVGQS